MSTTGPAAAIALEPGARLRLGGAWTLANLTRLAGMADALTLPQAALTIDAAAVTHLDTAGVTLLLRTLRRTGVPPERHPIEGLDPDAAALLELVIARLGHDPPPRELHASFRRMVERVGQAVVRFALTAREFLGFVGLVLATLAKVLTGRRRLRLTSTVFHMEQVGLDAVPIVALLTFLIGAVVAFLGATVLRDFGAEVFTVELVSVSFLREFGVLLTAILLAGRSGSAFTAQIGSMKAREEIDAIEALGLDTIELLVIPRLIALLLMLPVLTFVAIVSGILGGGIVGVLALDITPGMFVSRLHEMTDVSHFWVGMSKAPVFAFLIATVGCLEGLKVEGSAESVGRHTTASVVQSIFLVIVFDALFAIFYMELDI